MLMPLGGLMGPIFMFGRSETQKQQCIYLCNLNAFGCRVQVEVSDVFRGLGQTLQQRGRPPTGAVSDHGAAKKEGGGVAGNCSQYR